MLIRLKIFVMITMVLSFYAINVMADSSDELNKHLGFYGGIGIGISAGEIQQMNVSQASDDELSSTWKLFSGFRLNHNWGLELGYKGYDSIAFYPQRDQVSVYEVELDRLDLYFTPTFEFDPKGFLPLKLGLGLTYSELEFTVKESFFNLAASGEAKESDNDIGLYLMLGFKPFVFKRVSSIVSAEYILRHKMFDDSSNPVNTSEFSVTFSAMLH